ncbi:MAG: flagella basal body P-ring formation protein FlgA [Gammaproteobacteria bacterium]|nr:flagella basal body P-ring formation protein FlgA [Gammaproteobacteria bacterium]
MNNLKNMNSRIRHRFTMVASGWLLLSVLQSSIAGDLITDYEGWLAKKANEDLTLERRNFDRGLLKLSCSEPINFEFTNKSKRQVKATCNDEWRRFLKVPKSIAGLLIPKSVLVQEGKRKVAFVFKKNHEKGYALNSEDLRLARGNRSIPSNAISKLEGITGLYLQRDVVKGELLLRNDLKKAVKVFVAQKALPAGIQIDDSNFVQKKITHAVPSDYIEKLSGLEYMTTNKRIDVGKVLRERDLRKAKLVRRNEPVNLIYKTENFSIDAKGVSLSDGYFGSRIKAKNLESSLIVSGMVVDYGTISIN